MIAEAWFAVAVMLGVHNNGMQDILIFKQPEHGHFHSVEECKTFVQENPAPLVKTIWKFYGQRPVERVICVNKDVINKFIAQQNEILLDRIPIY